MNNKLIFIQFHFAGVASLLKMTFKQQKFITIKCAKCTNVACLQRSSVMSKSVTVHILHREGSAFCVNLSCLIVLEFSQCRGVCQSYPQFHADLVHQNMPLQWFRCLVDKEARAFWTIRLLSQASLKVSVFIRVVCCSLTSSKNLHFPNSFRQIRRRSIERLLVNTVIQANGYPRLGPNWLARCHICKKHIKSYLFCDSWIIKNI